MPRHTQSGAQFSPYELADILTHARPFEEDLCAQQDAQDKQWELLPHQHDAGDAHGLDCEDEAEVLLSPPPRCPVCHPQRCRPPPRPPVHPPLLALGPHLLSPAPRPALELRPAATKSPQQRVVLAGASVPMPTRRPTTSGLTLATTSVIASKTCTESNLI
ncbi:hypothetical protein B0H19DRAFT_1265775 [Mycena capillaripes]|nr:hypothetical protein B0H19DRAFT_1265775 [Mycena capillaripes]